MYRVIFKGQVPEEYVEEGQGRTLSDMWERGVLASKVNINGNLYESSSIKAILSGFANPDTQDVKEKNAEEMRRIDREHREGIDGILRQPAKVRAMNTSVAELMYSALTRTPMPENVREQVIARQNDYFESHPNWAHANPSCYKDLMPKPAAGKGEYHISNMTAMAGMNFIERIVQRGIN